MGRRRRRRGKRIIIRLRRGDNWRRKSNWRRRRRNWRRRRKSNWWGRNRFILGYCFDVPDRLNTHSSARNDDRRRSPTLDRVKSRITAIALPIVKIFLDLSYFWYLRR